MPDTAAQDAYARAEAAIAEAQRTEDETLDLSNYNGFGALGSLPPEIVRLTALRKLYLRSTPIEDVQPLASLANLQTLNLTNTKVVELAPLFMLTALRTLFLSNTWVSDISPLAELTALQVLDLFNTQVTDATPLTGLTALQALDLGKTQVRDLRPLRRLSALIEGAIQNNTTGLSFADCAATRRDPRLAELAAIEDAIERTRQTLAYLDEVGDDWPPAPPAADAIPPQNPAALTFDTDAAGRVTLIDAPQTAELPPQAATLHALLRSQATDLRGFCDTPNREHDRLCRLLDRYAMALGPDPQAMAPPPVLWVAGNALRNALKADEAKTGEEMGESPPLGPDRRADLTGLVQTHNAFSALHPDLVQLDHDQIDPVDRVFAPTDRDAIHQMTRVIKAQIAVIADQVRADFAELDAAASSNLSGAARALALESESQHNLIKLLLAEAVVQVQGVQRPTVRDQVIAGTWGAGTAILATNATLNPVIAQTLPELLLLLQPYAATLLSCWPGHTAPLREVLDWVVTRVQLNR